MDPDTPLLTLKSLLNHVVESLNSKSTRLRVRVRTLRLSLRVHPESLDPNGRCPKTTTPRLLGTKSFGT